VISPAITAALTVTESRTVGTVADPPPVASRHTTEMQTTDKRLITPEDDRRNEVIPSRVTSSVP